MKQISANCIFKCIKCDCKSVMAYFIKFLNYMRSMFFVVIWLAIPICYFVWMIVTKSYSNLDFIEFIILSILAGVVSLFGCILRKEWNVLKYRPYANDLMDVFLCFILFAILLIISTVIFVFDVYLMFIIIGILICVVEYVYHLYVRCSEKDV